MKRSDKAFQTCGSRCLAAMAAAILPLASLDAATTVAWQASTAAEDGAYRLSAPLSNWFDGAIPDPSLTGLHLRLFGSGRDVILHDLGDGFRVRQLQFTDGHKVRLLSGDSFVIGDGGITVGGSNAGFETLTVGNDLIAGTNATIAMIAAEGNTLVLAGDLSYDSSDATLTNFTWCLYGAGDFVLSGDWLQDAFPKHQHKLGGSSGASGTVYVDGRIRIPNIEVRNGERVVIRDGGTLETWNGGEGVYSFLQKSTVDVESGGRLLLLGQTCFAQVAGVTNEISVAAGGYADLRGSYARMANNGVSRVSVDGGLLHWLAGGRGGLTENGRTVVCVRDGGRIVVATSNGVVDEFHAGITSTRAAPAYPEGSEVRLESGGELVTTRICNRPNSETFLDVPVKIVFDGGVLASARNGGLFSFDGKATAERNQLRVIVRGGGAAIDTREGTGTLEWSGVAISGTDVEGGSDGAFEKRGQGAFRLSAMYESSGAFRVAAGSLDIADTAYFSGKALELRPRASVSFTGTALALSSLTAKDGIIRLSAGQSVSIGSAPSVDGALVFDVDTGTDGTYALLTGEGIDDSLAAKCRVLSPTAGKGAAFSVEGASLVLIVADGDAPDAPTLAASEDARAFYVAGDAATVGDADLAGTASYLSGGASVTYAGSGATLNADSFGAFGGMASSLTLGAGAGAVTFDGTPDLSMAMAEAAPVVRLSAASASGRFVFTGDWQASPPWTSAWFGFVFGSGLYSFDAGFFLDGSLSLNLAKGQTVSLSAPEISMEAATDATGATKAAPGEATTVVLDGIAVSAAAGGDGSMDDFFAGATALALGAGGASFDTQGLDVTVAQTLLADPAGAAASAGFEKRGVGTLTLGAGMNVIYGPLTVSGGTLKAGFATGQQKAYPSGALAIWDFDGDDPYADKSGHGYRLAQSHPDGRQVGFTAENAYLGSAAIFSNASVGASDGGSLCNADFTGTTFLRQSVSARVRLASYDVNSGIVSTRSKSDFSGSPGMFDLAYKTVWFTNGVFVTGGISGFGTIWGVSGASVWDYAAGGRPSLNEWHHIVMVQDNGVYTSYLDGVRYVDGFKGSAVQFIASGCMVTIGQGHATGEFMHNGGMIDEVIVTPRARSADEVKALHEGAQASASFAATVAADATWDLDGTTPTVRSLSGDGAVVNGTIAVTDAISVGERHTLSVERLAVPGADGVLDLGFGTETKPKVGETVEAMSIGEIDEGSLANLRRWTVTGAGRMPEGRSVSLSVDNGVLKATVRGLGSLFIIR